MENFIVYGLGKSGLSTIRSLANKSKENSFKNHLIIGTDDNLSSLHNADAIALKNQFSNVEFLACDEINFNETAIII
jgi:hypothetical protein